MVRATVCGTEPRRGRLRVRGMTRCRGIAVGVPLPSSGFAHGWCPLPSRPPGVRDEPRTSLGTLGMRSNQHAGPRMGVGLRERCWSPGNTPAVAAHRKNRSSWTQRGRRLPGCDGGVAAGAGQRAQKRCSSSWRIGRPPEPTRGMSGFSWRNVSTAGWCNVEARGAGTSHQTRPDSWPDLPRPQAWRRCRTIATRPPSQ